MKPFDVLDAAGRGQLPQPLRYWFLQPVWLRVAVILAAGAMLLGSILLPEFSMGRVMVFIPFFMAALTCAFFVVLDIMRTK